VWLKQNSICFASMKPSVQTPVLPPKKKKKKKKEPIKFQWTNSTGNLKKSKMNECKDRIAH
jgi:hypothetical protein